MYLYYYYYYIVGIIDIMSHTQYTSNDDTLRSTIHPNYYYFMLSYIDFRKNLPNHILCFPI